MTWHTDWREAQSLFFQTLPLVGKIPSRKGDWRKLKDWKPAGNETGYGIVAGPEHVIIDIDTTTAREKMEELTGWDILLDDLCFVETKKGYHFYFKADKKTVEEIGNRIRTRGSGIDVRAGWGYVVGPGSVVNGHFYRRNGPWVIYDLDEYPDLKQFLLREDPPGGDVVFDPQGTPSEEEPAEPSDSDADIPVGERNDTLSRIVYGHVMNTPLDARSCFELAMATNAQLSSPLERREIEAMVKGACKKRNREGKGVWVMPEWNLKHYKASAGFRASLLPKGLAKMGYEIRYNCRSHRSEIKQGDKEWRYMDGNDRPALTHMARERIFTGGLLTRNPKTGESKPSPLVSFPWASNMVNEAITTMGAVNVIDPFREWIERLYKEEPWDEFAPSVIDNLLYDFFTVEEESPDMKKVTVHAARTIILGAMWRTLYPGTKHDTMVVLVGNKAAGKSSFVKMLVPRPDEYVNGNLNFGMGLKQIVEASVGKVFCEFAEMEKLTRDIDATKAMLTSQVDTVRLSYRKDPDDVPRQWIPIGTTNNKQFLPRDNDPRGDRRFLPIRVDRGKRGWEDLIAHMEVLRPALWREAYYRVAICKERIAEPDPMKDTLGQLILGRQRNSMMEVDDIDALLIDYLKHMGNKVDTDMVRNNVEVPAHYNDGELARAIETALHTMGKKEVVVKRGKRGPKGARWNVYIVHWHNAGEIIDIDLSQ